MERILARIVDRLENTESTSAWTQLSQGLSPSELRTLMLAIWRTRAEARTPADLMRDADRLAVAPASADPRVMHALDGAAWEALAEDFEAVELGPVAPLGINAVLADTPQDNVLSATRGLEVLSDPTAAMALMAAQRRRSLLRANPKDRATVKLGCSARMMRMQPLKDARHTRHFRLFAMTSAGRDTGSDTFVCEALRDHVGFYLRYLEAAARRGWRPGAVEVQVMDPEVVVRLAARAGVDLHTTKLEEAKRILALAMLPRGIVGPAILQDVAPELDLRRPIARLENVRDQVFGPLKKAHPDVTFTFDFSRVRQATYYTGPCFHIYVHGFPMGPLPIADGGQTNWTAKLLGNRKERMYGSGIGAELIARMLPREEN